MFNAIDNNQSFYESFEKAVQKGLLYHVFFWIVFYFFLIIADNSEAPLVTKMVSLGIRLFFYIVAVSVNIYYLFPRLLKKDKLYSYLFSLILWAFVITQLELIIHYLILSIRTSSFSEVYTLQNMAKFFLSIFFIVFSSSIFQIINDWMEHQRERKDLQRQNLKSELKFLKSQINPHFFFNTLNSLYALTLKKSDRAPEIVLKLSDMMRYMLYESNERLISLQQEISYIKNYLELEKLRHGENFVMDIDIEGNPDGHQIAPLLFIPFLENSFKHGIDHELQSGYVKMKLSVSDNALALRVSNSIPKEALNPIPSKEKAGGIGLSNVRRRLNILYPNRYKLETGEIGEEYVVKLELQETKSKSK